MADRGLTAASITELNAAKVESYHLVSIGFSTPLYYTTAPYDIVYDTNTYLSNGTLINLPAIKESLSISPNTISLNLSGANDLMVAALLSEGKNAEVKIYRKLVGTGQVIQLFLGYTDEYAVSESGQQGKVDVKLKVSNHWADWESANGTVLSDSFQQQRYPGDLGLEFRPIVEFFTDKWGKSVLNERIFYDTNFGIFWPSPYPNNITLGFSFYDYWNPILQQQLNDDVDESKLPVIYGQVTVTGIPVFRTVIDSDPNSTNDAMWVVYALAEGECDSLVDVKFNDISYLSEPYASNVNVYFVSGTTTQTALTALVNESTLWTTNHRLQGICYAAIRYVYDADVWAADPKPEFTIKGKKVFDPRDSQTKYSTNPALILRDYLTSTSYGKGLNSALIDNINTPANIADSLETDHDGGEGGTPQLIPLMSFEGTINTYDSLKKNTEKILFCLRAYLPWVNGFYTVVQETIGESSVYTFDSDNISGTFKMSENSIRALANEINYTFIDADQANAKTTYNLKSATFLSIDNNRPLRKSISNLFETNRYRAENRANTELKRTRENLRVDLEASNSDALQIETGNIVDITRPLYGWTNKLFRVIEMTIGMDGSVNLGLIEYESTVFNWLVSAETVPPNDTSIANPFFIGAPTNLTMLSGTDQLLLEGDGTVVSRILVSWDTPATDSKAQGYNVYWKESTQADYNTPMVVPDNTMTSVYISPVKDGLIYDVAVAAISSFGTEGTRVTGQHTVIGKTAPPEDVQGFFAAQSNETVVLRWNQVSDVDLAGYEIRFGDAAATCCWTAATILTSVTRGTNITTADIPPGDWIIFIKAVDTSGNESINAAQQVITIISDQDIIYKRPQSKLWHKFDHPDNVLRADPTTWDGNASVVTSGISTVNNEQFQAYTINDNNVSVKLCAIYTEIDTYGHGSTWTASAFIYDSPVTKENCSILIAFKNGLNPSYAYITYNANTQVFSSSNDGTPCVIDSAGIVEIDLNWHFVYITAHSTTLDTTAVEYQFYPAGDAVADTDAQTVCNMTLVKDANYDNPRRSGVCDNPDSLLTANQDLTTWTKVGSPTVASSASVPPNGYGTAYTITDNSATVQEYIYADGSTGYVHGKTWTAAVFVEVDATNTDLCEIRLDFLNGAASSYLIIRFTPDAVNVPQSAILNATLINKATIKCGNWWFATVSGYSTTTGTDSVRIRIAPKVTAADTGAITCSDPALVPGIWDDPYVANMVRTHTGKMTPKSKALASENGFDVFDNFVVEPYNEGNFEAIEIDVGFDQTVRAFSWASTNLGPGQAGTFAGVNVYFDYRLAAGSYDGMELWSIDTVGLRYGRFQFLTDFSGALPVISEFEPTLDTVEHIESGVNVTVAIGGTAITFATPYNTTPYIATQVIATSLLVAVISSVSTTGFTVQVFDKSGAGSSGTDVGGTINWQATGV